MGENLERGILRASNELIGRVKQYGEKKGISLGEATDALLGTAFARLDALTKYAAQRLPVAPGKPKKVTKKMAKKVVKLTKKKGSKLKKKEYVPDELRQQEMPLAADG